MRKITAKYIRENYDLDAERKSYPTLCYVTELDLFDRDGVYSKEEFLAFIENEVKGLDDDLIIKVESFGHDGGFEINVYEDKERAESDQEVITRLTSIERKKRKKENDIEAAQKLLKEAGLL